MSHEININIDPELEKQYQQHLMTIEAASIKTKNSVFYEHIAKCIDDSKDKPWPNLKFPSRFVLISKGSQGEKQILEVTENDVCLLKEKKALESAIAYFIAENTALNKTNAYNFTPSEVVDCAKHWILRTRPIERPALVRQLGEPGLTFERLPWNLDINQRTPLFEELMSRIDNAKALMAFIGSLFFVEAKQQQYVYMLGDGQDGKGSLCSFLKKVFGKAAIKAQSTPVDARSGKPDPHFTSQFEHKRLIIFDDIEQTSFVRSGFFKSVTGGEEINVNPKGRAYYDIEHTAKFIVTSNSEPDLDLKHATLRRIILCKFDAPEKIVDPGSYQKSLWEEGGGFLAACLQRYKDDCPSHDDIPCDMLLAKSIAAENRSEFDDIFERCFELDENSYLEPELFAPKLRLNGVENKKIKAFKAWLSDAHGISKKPVKGSKKYYYKGLKIRSKM